MSALWHDDCFLPSAHGGVVADVMSWFGSAQWGDVATWVASVGTVAAVSVALWQAFRQRRVENDQLRSASEHARRDQAELISAWFSGPYRIAAAGDATVIEDGVAVNLFNGSRQLVYEVVVFLVYIQGAAPHTGEEWLELRDERSAFHVVVPVLQPGGASVKLHPVGGSPMAGHPGIEIAFTDRSRHHWIRRASGELIEIPQNAIDYYEIGRPVLYQVALPPYVDPRPV